MPIYFFSSPLVSHIRCNPIHATAMRSALQKIIRTVQSVASRSVSVSLSNASSSSAMKPKPKASRAKRAKANSNSHPICLDDIEDADCAEVEEDGDFDSISAHANPSMDTSGKSHANSSAADAPSFQTGDISKDRLAVLRRMATAAQRLGDARLGEIVVWQFKINNLAIQTVYFK